MSINCFYVNEGEHFSKQSAFLSRRVRYSLKKYISLFCILLKLQVPVTITRSTGHWTTNRRWLTFWRPSTEGRGRGAVSWCRLKIIPPNIDIRFIYIQNTPNVDYKSLAVIVRLHWSTVKKLSLIFKLILYHFDALNPKITLILLNQVNFFVLLLIIVLKGFMRLSALSPFLGEEKWGGRGCYRL